MSRRRKSKRIIKRTPEQQAYADFYNVATPIAKFFGRSSIKAGRVAGEASVKASKIAFEKGKEAYEKVKYRKVFGNLRDVAIYRKKNEKEVMNDE